MSKKKYKYSSFSEIQADVQRYKLEREIALEELKLVQHEVVEDLHPKNWPLYILSSFKKYIGVYLLKKIFK